MKYLILAVLAVVCVSFVCSAPKSLVLTRATREAEKESTSDSSKDESTNLDIYEFDINSNISNRYAKTLVTSKVRNPDNKAKEATFTVILPEKAFISEFIMEIKGTEYKAYVKEKEEAKAIYDKAVASGQSAGHVAVSARDSNRFTVSVNVEPESKATFYLTYEELLERRNNQYELVLNIHPGQLVKNLNIEVQIAESRPLKFIKTPSLRSGNEISKNEEKLDPSSDIQTVNSTSAIVKFKPDIEHQKEFGKALGDKENSGISGQFVVQYDVERDPNHEEVLLKDGYFVHFFAPDDIEPLPKHVVFVLDTSGSMYGVKIEQLKKAMTSILEELREVDIFHIVEFNSYPIVWNIETGKSTQVDLPYDEKEPFEKLSKLEWPPAVPSNKGLIEKGKSVINKFEADGGTNILDSLEVALYLVQINLKKTDKKFQPIIVFLTDGEVGNSDEVIEKISQYNKERDHVPLFSLSFGEGADKEFLRTLSLQNLGFSRHIYEAADAALQLQQFYKEISSPLLANVHFKYTSPVKDVSKSNFPIYFKGSEIVVVGRCDDDDIQFTIEGQGEKGNVDIKSVSKQSENSLERLWAYLTIKQKLEERELVENKTQLTKEALDLALQYSFVTDVTSLVVVKPNETSAVDTVDGSSSDNYEESGQGFGGYALPIGGPVYSKSLVQTQVSGRAYAMALPEADISYDFEEVEEELIVSSTPTDPSTRYRESLPWIIDVENSNGTINVLGGVYELDNYSTVVVPHECHGTPLNATETGLCTLLRGCPESYPYLPDFKTYEKYACIIENKYAGICCPKGNSD